MSAPTGGSLITRVERAILPLAVIGASTYLLAAGKIDSATAVAMISTAGGVGAATIVTGGRKG